MNAIHRASVLLALSLLFSFFGMASPAYADIAPPPPPNGMNILPGEEYTNVRMVSEQVIIEIAAQSNEENGHAVVTATFQMRNLGDAEERMDVRFPLCTNNPREKELIAYNCYYHYPHLYPPIQNFEAKVNGQFAAVAYTYEQVDHGTGQLVDLPIWANFPVVFPPGEDVTIQVKYIQIGYDGMSQYTPEFSYILYTGLGWKDTIGSAEIIVKVPYELNDMNLWEVWPENASVTGREVRWFFEDFEPAEQENSGISVTIVNPALWQKIETERKTVSANPKDGEAWGRLGRAYKLAVVEYSKSYIRSGNAAEIMYRESVAAYQKAVELLPNDANWHFGYADLLFPGSGNCPIDGAQEECQTAKVEMMRQLKLALDINPNHQRAREMVEMISYHQPGLIDLSGAQPVFLGLTQTPTLYPVYVPPTLTPTLTPQPTITPSPSPTTQPTETAAAVAVVTLAPTPTAAPQPTPAPASALPVCGMVLLPLVVLFVMLRRR